MNHRYRKPARIIDCVETDIAWWFRGNRTPAKIPIGNFKRYVKVANERGFTYDHGGVFELAGLYGTGVHGILRPLSFYERLWIEQSPLGHYILSVCFWVALFAIAAVL
jgi:hypothetical protein